MHRSGISWFQKTQSMPYSLARRASERAQNDLARAQLVCSRQTEKSKMLKERHLVRLLHHWLPCTSILSDGCC
jgi:hypothetical protein